MQLPWTKRTPAPFSERESAAVQGAQMAGFFRKRPFTLGIDLLVDGRPYVDALPELRTAYDWRRFCRGFGSLKTERLRGRVYLSRDEARSDMSDYTEVFYNRQRRHGHLDTIHADLVQCGIQMRLCPGSYVGIRPIASSMRFDALSLFNDTRIPFRNSLRIALKPMGHEIST